MLNPVFRREMNTTLRSWKIYGALTAYVLLLALVEQIALSSMTNSSYSYYGYSVGFNPQSVAQLYAILAGFQFVLIAIITPALTAGSIAGERERQTLNLMLITKMSTFKIAVGKLMSSLSIVVLLIIASMPVFAMVFYYGGVSVLDLLAVTLYTILSAAAMGSICIFLSSLFKRTVSATVLGYLSIMALCIGTFIAAIILYAVYNVVVRSLGFYGYRSMPNTAVPLFTPEQISLMIKTARGSFIAILALNPFVGFLSIVDAQLGTEIIDDLFYELTYYSSYGFYNSAYTEKSVHLWIYNSIVNIAIVALMLFLTSRVLKPVKESRKNK